MFYLFFCFWSWQARLPAQPCPRRCTSASKGTAHSPSGLLSTKGLSVGSACQQAPGQWRETHHRPHVVAGLTPRVGSEVRCPKDGPGSPRSLLGAHQDRPPAPRRWRSACPQPPGGLFFLELGFLTFGGVSLVNTPSNVAPLCLLSHAIRCVSIVSQCRQIFQNL